MSVKEEQATAVVGIPVGPRVQRREKWIDLPGDYEGFQFRLWLNAPAKTWNEVTDPIREKESDEDAEQRRQAALSKLILEHNGWLDEEGNRYPAPNTPEFWEEIPNELATAILAAAQVEMGKLALSLMPKRRR